MSKVIKNIDGSFIELDPVIRGKSIIGYSIWLSQGSLEHPTEYVISLHEVDQYIEGLIEARDQARQMLIS